MGKTKMSNQSIPQCQRITKGPSEEGPTQYSYYKLKEVKCQMYVLTCLNCKKPSWSTRPEVDCPICGTRRYIETVEQRDIRLGISHKNIRSFDVEDELRGIQYEEDNNEATKEINQSTEDIAK